MDKLEEIFSEIKKILKEQSKDYIEADKYIGSKAKMVKPEYHLYGAEEVSILGKKPENTYIAGVIQQKNYVSFYFSPIYSHPDSFEDISPDLKRYLKGKSCFNITKGTAQIYKEIDKLLKKGINKYKELEWI